MPRRTRPPRHAARSRSAKGLERKRQGELAELCFALRAASHGLVVSRPHGDTAPYDFLVDGGGLLQRVQVKSGSVLDRSEYRVNAKHGAQKRSYTSREIDVLAAYIVPEDTWYLIPVDALGRRTMLCFAPHLPHSKGQFAPYRECWQVLGAKTDEVQRRNR